jgi:hypothetical protein
MVRIMMEHGGVYHHYYNSRKTTHIIASNLPDVKVRQLKGPELIVKVIRGSCVQRASSVTSECWQIPDPHLLNSNPDPAFSKNFGNRYCSHVYKRKQF